MLTGRAMRRRGAVAAAIPPLIRLRGQTDTVPMLALELGQPERVVEEASRALERAGWVTIVGSTLRLTRMAETTMDAWDTEMQGALCR